MANYQFGCPRCAAMGRRGQGQTRAIGPVSFPFPAHEADHFPIAPWTDAEFSRSENVIRRRGQEKCRSHTPDHLPRFCRRK